MRKKVTVRFQMFATLMALFLIPTFLFCLLGYHWARINIVKNAKSTYQAAMQNTAERLERDIENRKNIVTLFNKTLLLRKLTYMQGETVDYSRVNVDDLHEYKTQLVFHCAGSPIFDEIAVCFPKKNLVISSLGLWNLDWFLQDEFHVQDVTSAQWKELFRAGGTLYGKKVLNFGYAKQGVVWVQPGENGTQGEPLMTVIFFAGADTLKGYLEDLALFPGTSAALLAPDGTLIQALEGNLRRDELLSACLECSEDGKVFPLAGAPYELLRLRSAPSGFTLCALLPRDALYGEVHGLMFAMGLILLTMTAIGLALSWELAAINYRPMERLLATLGARFTRGAPTRQDMEGVEKKLLDILREQENLQSRMAESRDMLQYAALSHLLEGDTSFGSLSKGMALELLDLPMPYDRFAVAVLVNVSDPAKVPDRLSALQEGRAIKFYPLRQRDQFVVVLNWQGESLDGFVYHALGSLCACACFSRVCEGADMLAEAMREAREAMLLRPLESSICFYQENRQPGTLYYPPELEKALLSALREGNAEKTLSLLDELLQMNRRADTRGKLLVAVEWTAIKTDDGKGYLSRRLKGLPPQAAIEARVAGTRELLKQAAAYHRERIEQTKSAFAEEMLSLIDEHITDEQLSLGVLAGRLGVTPTYLSRYFKEQFHMGYLDYVNKKRILLAKRMLNETRLSIREVAVASGFGNDATFRRVFKKYEGMAPSHAQQSEIGEKP